MRYSGLPLATSSSRANNTPCQTPLCPKRRPPRPQQPIFGVFHRGGLHFERRTTTNRDLTASKRGNGTIRGPDTSATRRQLGPHAANPRAGQIGNQRRAYSTRLVPNCGTRRQRRGIAGLQNDADHPPTHQAPPAWRATRELRDDRGLAVGLGGGARGRRGLDGMCTAMKNPTCVEGAGGSGGLGRASRSTTPSRRLACGDLAGGRTRRHPEHPWGHKQQTTSETGRAAAHRHAQRPSPNSQASRRPENRRTQPHNDTRPRPVSRPRPRRAQSVPLSKAAPPAIRRSCPHGPRPRRGRPRGGRRGRGRGSRTRSRHPRCGRSGSTAGRHRARHTRRA